MHDPRLGTYGVVALIGSLGLRVALLAPLATGAFARAVVAGHVLGRASTLLAVRVASPLPDSSAGQLASGLPLSGVVLAAGTAVGAVVWASGVWGIPVLVVAGVLASAGARLCHHRFGGLGGDSLGAVNQVVHLAVLSAVAAVVA